MIEIEALRELEKAVRALGVPNLMTSGERQLQSLADALKGVEEARYQFVLDNVPGRGAR